VTHSHTCAHQTRVRHSGALETELIPRAEWLARVFPFRWLAPPPQKSSASEAGLCSVCAWIFLAAESVGAFPSRCCVPSHSSLPLSLRLPVIPSVGFLSPVLLCSALLCSALLCSALLRLPVCRSACLAFSLSPPLCDSSELQRRWTSLARLSGRRGLRGDVVVVFDGSVCIGGDAAQVRRGLHRLRGAPADGVRRREPVVRQTGAPPSALAAAAAAARLLRVKLGTAGGSVHPSTRRDVHREAFRMWMITS